MSLFPPPSTLLPRQTRMIDARGGLRLEVLEGCLWLTRPGDASDRFVQAGASIELGQNEVLIQCERSPSHTAPVPVRYRLVSLVEAPVQQVQRRPPHAPIRPARSWWPLKWLGLA